MGAYLIELSKDVVEKHDGGFAMVVSEVEQLCQFEAEEERFVLPLGGRLPGQHTVEEEENIVLLGPKEGRSAAQLFSFQFCSASGEAGGDRSGPLVSAFWGNAVGHVADLEAFRRGNAPVVFLDEGFKFSDELPAAPDKLRTELDEQLSPALPLGEEVGFCLVVLQEGIPLTERPPVFEKCLKVGATALAKDNVQKAASFMWRAGGDSSQRRPEEDHRQYANEFLRRQTAAVGGADPLTVVEAVLDFHPVRDPNIGAGLQPNPILRSSALYQEGIGSVEGFAPGSYANSLQECGLARAIGSPQQVQSRFAR